VLLSRRCSCSISHATSAALGTPAQMKEWPEILQGADHGSRLDFGEGPDTGVGGSRCTTYALAGSTSRTY
jgi:hypothetical protein